MTSKVGISNSVTYGIGVQNRYSAFLDEEDGLIAASPLVTESKRQNKQALQKPKGNGLQVSVSQKHVTQPGKGGANGQSSKADDKRHSQRGGGGGQIAGNAPASSSTRSNYNNRNENNSNGHNKFMRNQPNGNHYHQSNQQNNNQENNAINTQQSNGRNNFQPRFNNRPRQFNYEDKKIGYAQQDGQTNGSHVNSIGNQSSIDEEKCRRQQKRALDLKHKDPEKREARRQQATGAPEQSNSSEQPTSELAQAENNSDQASLRNRRNGNRNPDERGRFSFSKNGRGRGRRQDDDTSGEGRDGQQGRAPGAFGGERIARNRNGFGNGSRGSRGSRGDTRNLDRARPIPNFSDKLDFPSLAS